MLRHHDTTRLHFSDAGRRFLAQLTLNALPLLLPPRAPLPPVPAPSNPFAPPAVPPPPPAVGQGMPRAPSNSHEAMDPFHALPGAAARVALFVAEGVAGALDADTATEGRSPQTKWITILSKKKLGPNKNHNFKK